MKVSKNSDPIVEFKEKREGYLQELSKNKEEIDKIRNDFEHKTAKYHYSYNFNWMGRPIIQYPQDILAMQEIIWEVKPDIIIETGVAHGGSLIFYASLLELIGNGEVLGIDIDIRKHNHKLIKEHPMSKRINLIEGSSISNEVLSKVKRCTKGKSRVIVCLDSNHTHEHVLKELELYSPMVTKGSYLIVFDTIIEDMLDEDCQDRPWGKGNNAKTAVHEFIKSNNRFAIDYDIENKLIITASPDGYLKCIK